jgi:hypothetical protein
MTERPGHPSRHGHRRPHLPLDGQEVPRHRPAGGDRNPVPGGAGAPAAVVCGAGGSSCRRGRRAGRSRPARVDGAVQRVRGRPGVRQLRRPGWTAQAAATRAGTAGLTQAARNWLQSTESPPTLEHHNVGELPAEPSKRAGQLVPRQHVLLPFVPDSPHVPQRVRLWFGASKKRLRRVRVRIPTATPPSYEVAEGVGRHLGDHVRAEIAR